MKGIRATEVRAYIAAKGEHGMVECLEQAYERIAALESELRDAGIMMLNMAKIIDQVTSGAGAMREQLERMQGKEDDDDLPTAVQ